MERPDPASTAYALVQQQAADEGLWFVAQYASEAYLQQALRELHRVVEAEHRRLTSRAPHG